MNFVSFFSPVLEKQYEIRKAIIGINSRENLDVYLINSNIYLRDIFLLHLALCAVVHSFIADRHSSLHTLPRCSGFICTRIVMTMRVGFKEDGEIGWKGTRCLSGDTYGKPWLHTQCPQNVLWMANKILLKIYFYSPL